MRKIIFILFTITISVYAQRDNTSQSIELPDFVITGIQAIQIPEMDKPKPELIPTLSEEFFKPKPSPDELDLVTLNNPIAQEVDLLGKIEDNNGLLILGGGLNTLPTGDFYFNQGFQNFLFKTHVWGTNTTEFVDHAGYNISGASGSVDIFVGNKSTFLPGLNINASGKYFRDSYKFFGSDTPSLKRETENTFIRFGITNLSDSKFKYGVNGSTHFLKLKENNFKEDLYKGNAFFEFAFGKFSIGSSVNYFLQDLRHNISQNDNIRFFDGEIYVSVFTSNDFKVKFGLYFSKLDTAKFFSPNASFVLKLDRNFTFYGEYYPHTKFLTMNDFIRENRYLNLTTVDNILTEYRNFSKIAVKYQFDKFFEIDGGLSFSKVDNMHYYSDSLSNGKFEVLPINGVSKFGGFLSLMFYEGPMGFLYSQVNYDLINSEKDLKIPYYPEISLLIKYGYNFDFGLSFSTSVKYYQNVYTDLKNTDKLPSLINLETELEYNLFSKFDLTVRLENLLNRKNFFISGYQEKPFDIIAGIEYRW